MSSALRFLFCAAAAGVLLATPARAHDPGLSTVEGKWSGRALELNAGFSFVDARLLLPAMQRPERLTAADIAAQLPAFDAIARQLWSLSCDGVAVELSGAGAEILAGDNISLRVTFSVPAGTKKLRLEARRLGTLPPGHRQFVFVTNAAGSPLAKKLLTVDDAQIDVAGSEGGPPGEAKPETPAFFAFLRLGIEHIWTGYDHLLFLFSLLIVCRSFRSVATVISCFTLAHSLTLALATLDLVNVPSRITEPAIAASIVFVAVENLLRRGNEPRGRWAVTFAFGLIHGFGFASVLRDLGVGGAGQGIALPLFTFNLGVEIGQVAIAAIVLPAIWRLRRSEAFVRRGVPALSVVVALAGAYWFAERVFWT